MRALVVSRLTPDLSGTAIIDIPAPVVAGPGTVLIRVKAAALNSPDLLMTRGDYQLKPPLPFVPVMEVAGEVVADPGGTFAVGDAVVAAMRTGGMAEVVAADLAAVRHKPERLTFAEAAGVGATYLTAYVALVRLAAVQAGEWVLVHGATGGVGLAAIDLAKALGCRVIATSRSADKLAIVARTHPVDATCIAPGFRDEVKALTGGGADVILDPVGGATFDESTRAIAFGGRLLVVGFTSGRIATVPATYRLSRAFR